MVADGRIVQKRLDVVGAGICGLAHAWHAARAGWQVRVFERDPAARSASVRNFGMIWPIGQGLDRRAVALRSRELWKELVEAARLWSEPRGSLHVARAEDELAVLEDFRAHHADGLDVELLTPDLCVARGPFFRREGLLAGLFSASEMCVNPREVISSLPAFLAECHGVEFRFREPVIGAVTGRLRTSRGTYHNDAAVVCSGADMETLFPECFDQQSLTRVKLQMMRAAAPAGGRRIGPLMAAGLTLLHYASFAPCATLPALRARLEAEWPFHIARGIHVMVSQHGDGQLTIGDSHDYGLDLSPFNRSEVDEAILTYLGQFADFPDLKIEERWEGMYPIFTDGRFLLREEPVEGVRVFNGLGGAGMTLSLGAAEDHLRQWLDIGVLAEAE